MERDQYDNGQLSDSDSDDSAVKVPRTEENLDDQITFTPREYQTQLLESALEKNIIVYLGTGTGKTFIAVMLIRELSHEVRLPFESGGKRTIFLVPTVPLVMQQQKVLADHTDLKVYGLCGDMGIDYWTKEQWQNIFSKNQVLIMTGEICKIILHHDYLPLSKVNLLVFDECHRATKGHPYAEVLKKVELDKSLNPPKVFGLSACLLNGKCKPVSAENKIRELERTMRACVGSVDISSHLEYGTHPKTYLVYYKPCMPNLEIGNLLAGIKPFGDDYEASSELYNEMLVKPDKSCSVMKSILDISDDFCSYYAVEKLLEQIENVLEKDLKDSIQKGLMELKKILEKIKEKLMGSKSNYQLNKAPHKLKRLLEVLRKFNEKHPKALCAILFVKERIIAYVLDKWLQEISKKYSQYSFLNSCYVVGHGQKVFSDNQNSMTTKQQKEALEKFRSGEFNIVVSTSVLEEGLDVKKCNLVIRFDFADEFRSYIQAKGRARASDAAYVLMACANNKEQTIADLYNYLCLEEGLINVCRNRQSPDEKEIEFQFSKEPIHPYQPKLNGPCITMVSSVRIIHRYCGMLPCDMATNLVPRWKICSVPSTKITGFFEYQCTLWLPINSCLKEPIVGDLMPSKKQSKMSAALKACIKLHQLGELNENFTPIGCCIEETEKEIIGEYEEEKIGDGISPGTKKCRRWYNKRIPKVLKDCLPKPGIPCYLYFIFMKLTKPLEDKYNQKKRKLYDPADSSLGLGILTTKLIPPINSFPVYTDSGEITVHLISPKSACQYSEEQLSLLSKFHRFLFSDMLRLENDEKVFLPENALTSYYIVPVNTELEDKDFSIDWNFAESVFRHEYFPLKQRSNLKPEDYNQIFTDAVVRRDYSDNSCYEFYYVTEVCHDLNICNNVGDKYGTYQEFYKGKYGISVTNSSQPLLCVRPFKTMNLIKFRFGESKVLPDGTMSKTMKRKTEFNNYFIPELCRVQPIPFRLWMKAECIPSILYRVSNLLVANELRENIACESGMTIIRKNQGVGNNDNEWPKYDFDAESDKELLQKKFNIKSILSFNYSKTNQNFFGPHPGIVLKAFTQRSAGDSMDMERLETLGDSFLKYAVTAHLYSVRKNYDEGKLSLLRTYIIRNVNLFYKGKAKCLGEVLITSPFSPTHSFLPPCYGVRSNACESSDEKKECFFTRNEVNDKCIADSVEALIGVYLLTCGQYGALKLMHWLDIKIFPDECEWWLPPPISPLLNPPKNPDHLETLFNEFKEFEEKIGYVFKDKYYLLQAFTHPSYSFNEFTDCYQRLEFLGDAILDFLITSCLYQDPKQHDPGQLTDLRSALVNNSYFAYLAIKFGYYKKLKHESPSLWYLINDFVDRIRNSSSFQHFEVYGYLEEEECVELDDIEVPKALGDIFESVAGAIYLDSGMSLNAVWNVYYPMMKPAIEHLAVHVPLPPIRVLYEKKPDAKFEYGEAKFQKIKAVVKLQDDVEFEGFGRSKAVAKRSAAKHALRELKKQRKEN